MATYATEAECQANKPQVNSIIEVSLMRGQRAVMCIFVATPPKANWA
jgi:hypothetical protein